MALLGNAALAMWWNMAADLRADFEHWHTHEHFPERLGIPGFLRASRWMCAAGGEAVFVLYELEDYAVLSSASYLARLNEPTPWSTRLMPHHRNMVRSQNQVLASRGAGVARHALTLRLSPRAGQEDALRAGLAGMLDRLAFAPGFSGLHLLRHRSPDIAPTTEQKIRGGADQVADWVLVVSAYDAAVLDELERDEGSDAALERLGACCAPAPVRGRYSLASSATRADMR